MEKIRIQNVKTGKVSEITKSAWDQLKRGGHSKNFDVIPTEKKVVSFNVESKEPKEPKESKEQTETTESKESTEQTEIEKPKRKSTKSNEQ
jgi:hypothetical protein